MKGLSVVLSFALLVLVNYLAARLKRARLLPVEVARREMTVASNGAPPSASRTNHFQNRPPLKVRKWNRV